MLSLQLLRAGVLAPSALGLCMSCSLDQRQLQLGSSFAGFWIIAGAPDSDTPNGGGAGEGGADGGQAGDAAGSPANGGGLAGGSTAGSAGTGGSTGVPALVDGCPDLDLNGKGDCKETLAKNPGFASDTQAWAPGADASLEWSSQNHFQDLPSGSALVTAVGTSDIDGIGLSAVTQCVELASGARMEAFASAFVKGDQGDGAANLSVFFYPQAACIGTLLGAPILESSSQTGAWQTLSAKQPLPEGTKSALVRLAVTKPYRSPQFVALFDNVLIRTP